MTELILIVLGFIALSGFFALIDAAILNITPAEVEVMIAKKKWGARELRRLLRHTTRAIVIIVIFTNITNILGPILAGKKAVELYGSEAIGYITAILTLGTIVFSEIVPKSLGAHYAPTIARMAAPLLWVVSIILYPVVFVLEAFVRIFKSGKRKVGTEEQIRALANLGGGAGHIDADERELIHRAFVLNDRKAKDIMTPIGSVVCMSAALTIRQAAKMIFTDHYSRYPVTGDIQGDVLGYVISRDILKSLADGKGELPVATVLRDLPTVKAALPCDELLNALRKNAEQLALVVDQGRIIGMVTLEDVLEELVGEITDEGDTESETVSKDGGPGGI